MFIRRFEVLAGNKTCEETYRKRHIDIEWNYYVAATKYTKKNIS